MRDFSSTDLGISVLFLSGTFVQRYLCGTWTVSGALRAVHDAEGLAIRMCVRCISRDHAQSGGIYPLLTAACAIVGTGFSLQPALATNSTC